MVRHQICRHRPNVELHQVHMPPLHGRVNQRSTHKTIISNTNKRQLFPHKHRNMVYDSKQQFIPDEDTNPKIDQAGIQQVQAL